MAKDRSEEGVYVPRISDGKVYIPDVKEFAPGLELQYDVPGITGEVGDFPGMFAYRRRAYWVVKAALAERPDEEGWPVLFGVYNHEEDSEPLISVRGLIKPSLSPNVFPPIREGARTRINDARIVGSSTAPEQHGPYVHNIPAGRIQAGSLAVISPLR